MSDPLVERLRTTAQKLTVGEHIPKFCAEYLEAADRIDALTDAVGKMRKMLAKTQRRMWDLHGSSLGHIKNELMVQRWRAEVDEALKLSDEVLGE